MTSVRRVDDGYLVRTSGGELQCRTVVVASGAFNRPTVPPFSDGGAGLGHSVDALRLPQSRRSFPTAGSSWSERRRRAYNWPPSWRDRAGR